MDKPSAMAGSSLLSWLVRLTFVQVSLAGHQHARHNSHGHIHHIARHRPGSQGGTGLEARRPQGSPPGNAEQGYCGTTTITTTVSVVLPLSAGDQKTEYDLAVPFPTFFANETVSIETRVVSEGTAQVLPSLTNREPQTTGVVVTTLDLENRVTSCPIIEEPIPTPTSLIEEPCAESQTPAIPPSVSDPGVALPSVPVSLISSLSVSLPEEASESASIVLPTLPSLENTIIMPSGDIFAEPIATAAPPQQITVRDDHPQEKKGVTSTPPIQTNKFFGNFLVGDQAAPTYTFPYSVTWAAGRGATSSYGLAISHIEANQRVFGNTKANGAAAYFINPVGIQSLIIGAKELSTDTALATDSITAFSARVHLRPNNDAVPVVSFPLVQGMAFVTAQYAGGTPTISTGVFFKNVTRVTKDPKAGVAKFNFHLEDGMTWRVYAFATRGEQLDLRVLNNGYAEASRPFYGLIQIAKDPGNAEAIYDEAAGVFPTTMKLTGTAQNTTGTYTFHYEKEGHPDGKLLMYALPHHVESFDVTTRGSIKEARLQTPTKGVATAVMADSWTMVESDLPIDMTFLPWDPQRGSMRALSNEARAVIRGVAVQEASQNMAAQSDLDSMYFSGKVWHTHPVAAFPHLLLTLVGIGQVCDDARGHQRYP